MKTFSRSFIGVARPCGQRGLVLFFALLGLLVLSLAAAALIRSVDTSTLIAGNLAFKQSAANSGDVGMEGAMTLLATVQAANASTNVLTAASHPFNQDAPTSGYYSAVHDNSADAAFLNLFADATWVDATSKLVGTDNAGNTTRYIIQRMCRTSNQPIQTAGCLFSGALQDSNGQHVQLPQEVCQGAGCPVAGQTPILRITSRVIGPKNTVSYTQAFVY